MAIRLRPDRANRPLFDVAAHLLGTTDRAGELLVIHLREIIAGRELDPPARFFEEVDGGFFQAALGQADFQDVHFLYTSRGSKTGCPVTLKELFSTRRKKQLA